MLIHLIQVLLTELILILILINTPYLSKALYTFDDDSDLDLSKGWNQE